MLRSYNLQLHAYYFTISFLEPNLGKLLFCHEDYHDLRERIQSFSEKRAPCFDLLQRPASRKFR